MKINEIHFILIHLLAIGLLSFIAYERYIQLKNFEDISSILCNINLTLTSSLYHILANKGKLTIETLGKLHELLDDMDEFNVLADKHKIIRVPLKEKSSIGNYLCNITAVSYEALVGRAIPREVLKSGVIITARLEKFTNKALMEIADYESVSNPAQP